MTKSLFLIRKRLFRVKKANGNPLGSQRALPVVSANVSAIAERLL
jgi:hypothetical protein